ILMGDRKSNQGLVAGQLDTLKDPKKMAELGFHEGIGFIPFAGMGYGAFKNILKDDSLPVRAAAAKILADDPDPISGDALAQEGVADKSELVRVAALEAIATRGDAKLVNRIEPALSDDKDSVKYTASAAIVHLLDLAEQKTKRRAQPAAKPKQHI